MPNTSPILANAEQLLSQRGERLTDLRRQILNIVADAPAPLSAYQIIDEMGIGAKRPAPPTVYRTLDFLMAQGLVHKVHSRNTFVACPMAAHPHAAELLICRTCGLTLEIAKPESDPALTVEARDLGFEPERRVIEVEGVCQKCRGAS